MLIILIVFLLGSAIGSFLNVIIFRVHADVSVWRGRSKCLACQQTIGVLDLIPIASFFFLKGRCRHCKSKLSWQYPLVELITGILFVLFYLKHQFVWFESSSINSIEGLYSLIRDWTLICFLVIIFIYDHRHMLIIDRFTFPAMIVAVVLNLLVGGVSTTSMLLGALVIGGFFYGQFAVSKGKWVGGGDIRLGALMGLILGLPQSLVALFFAYVMGAMIGLLLLLFKKASRNTPVPFGTFLSLATVMMMFLGSVPLQWYLSFFI